MLNIKPISDLRNYTEVLKEVKENSPVYLTRNRRERKGGFRQMMLKLC